MKVSVERGEELGREPRRLPAGTYNLARALIVRRAPAAVFVPIRPMQYLAILDAEEFVFVDSQFKDRADIVWCAFRPRDRRSLNEPVAYQAVYFRREGRATMQRLQAEFDRALAACAARQHEAGPARLLAFAPRRSLTE
jgi:hypothetical protein